MSSAGQVIGGVVGAVIGYFIGGPSGAYYGFTIGAGIGGYVDQPDRQGPRLEDLRSQVSSYGNNIPFCYGVNRFAGTVIWPRIIEAEEHEHSESAKGGPSQVNFTYTLSFAILVCEGPIAGVRRIWANKKLVYDISSGNEGATQDPAISSIRFYNGTNDQDADPLIEAREGNTPNYRGYAYVVFEDYDVTELNGRVPQFEFEVITDGVNEELAATSMGDGGGAAAYYPNSDLVWSVEGTANSHIDVYITDVVNEVLVDHITVVPNTLASSLGNDITYVPQHGEFWIADENGTDIIAINAETHAVRQIDFGKSWTGKIHYSPSHGQVILGVTNASTKLWVVEPISETILGSLTFAGSVYGIDKIATLQSGYEAVLYRDNVSICNIAGAASTIVNTFYNADIGTSADMATDTNRNRIVIINENDSLLITLDLETGDYVTYTLTLPDDAPSNASISMHRIMWHSQNDRYYITAHHAGFGWTLITVNPESFAIETVRVYSGPTNYGTLIEVDNRPNFIAYADHGSRQVWKLPLTGTLDPNQVVLSDIVSDLWQRTGLTSGQINVSALTDLVDGFLVGRQMTSRSATEPLQTAYQFDVVESEGKIKAVKRGSGTITTIPLADRAAHIFGEDVPVNLEIMRSFEYELPYQCDVEYADVDADHQIGNQYDRRITKDTRQRINLQLPISMTAEKAKQIAKIVLYDAWKKQSFKFSTSIKYAYLEPTDLIYLPNNSITYTAMITNRRDQPSGIIEWEARIEDLDTYTQSGADAVPIQYTPQTIFEPADTILELMDSPLMRDEDQNDGFYVAMGGATPSWRGGQLFRSDDGGSTYTSVLSAVDASVIGAATTILGDFTDGDVFDEGNSVTVVIETGKTLTSYTEDQVLAGYGAFLLGENGRWEVCNYKTATLIAEGTYTLTGLLRGRRGTEWAIGNHQVGDRFIFGDVDTWRVYNPPSTDLNVQRQYKAPSFRANLADAEVELYTDRAIRRRPYSVSHLKADPLNDGGLSVSWLHRSLVGSSWDTGLVVPLDATFESFSVTISSVEGVILRQFSTTDEAFPYSAADIEDDFGDIPPAMLIRVAQRNTDYGDGVGATLHTADGSITYDFTDPFSTPYVPPDTTAPPDTPGDGDPIPPGNQWFGPDYWAPALWDGTNFIASNVYGKAVISTGALWTSSDGLNYTQLTSNNMTIPLKIAAYHGGTYVNQYNSSKPWYSTDLEAWTEGAFNSYPSGYPYDSGSPFSKIIHDGTRFVALRRNGEIMGSSTAATWDHKCNVTIPSDTSANLVGNGLEAWGLAFGSGVYVAVGLDPSGGPSLSDRIWTSSNYDGPYTARDGAPIVDHGGGPIDKAYLYSVTFCSDDGYFYAVGSKRYYFEPSSYYVSTGVIIRSTDGITWSDVTPTPVVAPTYTASQAFSFHKITGGYVVLGTNAYWTSSDGSTWTENPLSPYNENQLYSLQLSANNGSIVATQEYQWLQSGAYINYYRKPITFDGSVFDPTLDSPYP